MGFLPALIPVISAIGGAVSAGGAIVQGVGAANAGAVADQAGRNNQALADQAATDALRRGETEVGKLQLQVGKVRGAARTAYAASGVDTSQGSPTDVAAETEALSETDKQTIRNNARMEAWGFRTQGLQFAQQGKQAAAAAGGQALASGFAAGGSLLTGAMDTYKNYRLSKG